MGVALRSWVDSASAQITPDNTMGGENSRVTSSGEVDAIKVLLEGVMHFNCDATWFNRN